MRKDASGRYHDLLFAHQDALERPDLRDIDAALAGRQGLV